MRLRGFLRTSGALFIAAVSVTSPRGLDASPVPTKLQYCSTVCLGATMDCPLSNSAEYCSAFYVGCVNSCVLF